MTRRSRFVLLAVLGACLLITLPMSSWTASSPQVSGTVSASGWSALQLIRYVLLLVVLECGLLAFAGLQETQIRGRSVRDLAHILAGVAALALLALLFRIPSPPHFATVTSEFDGVARWATMPPRPRRSGTAASGVVFFAATLCAAIAWPSVLTTQSEDGGLDPRHIVTLTLVGRSRFARWARTWAGSSEVSGPRSADQPHKSSDSM